MQRARAVAGSEAPRLLTARRQIGTELGALGTLARQVPILGIGRFEVAMLDREFVRENRRELSYLTGRFLTEHLIRVHAAFEGDLTAAVVLGTIGHHYIQRFYDEVARDSPQGLDRLVDGGRAPAQRAGVQRHVGECGDRHSPRDGATQGPLAGRQGMGRRRGGGALTLVPGMSKDFEEFDLETIARFHHAARGFMRQVHALQGALARRRNAGYAQ